MEQLDITTISSSVKFRPLTWALALLFIIIAVLLLIKTMPYYNTNKAYIAYFLIFATVMLLVKLKIDPNADEKGTFTRISEIQEEYRYKVTDQECIEYLELNPNVENVGNNIYRFTVTTKYDAYHYSTSNWSDYVKNSY